MKRLIAILLIVYAGGCAQSEPVSDSSSELPTAEVADRDAMAFAIDRTERVVTLDTRAAPPQKRRFDLGQGSITLETLTATAGQLTFRYTPEVEGGFTVYECTVPVSPEPLTFKINADGTPGETSFDLADCKLIESGSLLDDQLADASQDTVADRFFAHLEVESLPGGDGGVVAAVFDADPTNEKIVGFVKHLASNEIQLAYHPPTQRWHVDSDRFGAFQFEIESLGAFPDDATELEMQAGCLAINLAHGLNLQARLIMSPPQLRRAAGDPEQASVYQNKLKQLFMEYDPR